MQIVDSQVSKLGAPSRDLEQWPHFDSAFGRIVIEAIYFNLLDAICIVKRAEDVIEKLTDHLSPSASEIIVIISIPAHIDFRDFFCEIFIGKHFSESLGVIFYGACVYHFTVKGDFALHDFLFLWKHNFITFRQHVESGIVNWETKGVVGRVVPEWETALEFIDLEGQGRVVQITQGNSKWI